MPHFRPLTAGQEEYLRAMERHEVVLCLSGGMVLHQEHPDGACAEVTLAPGQYVINPPGVWHTVDVVEPTTGLFITAGLGTQHRPR